MVGSSILEGLKIIRSYGRLSCSLALENDRRLAQIHGRLIRKRKRLKRKGLHRHEDAFDFLSLWMPFAELLLTAEYRQERDGQYLSRILM
jgi:hypothetical protein